MAKPNDVGENEQNEMEMGIDTKDQEEDDGDEDEEGKKSQNLYSFHFPNEFASPLCVNGVQIHTYIRR